MCEKTYVYSSFNIDQIMPVLSDINTGKFVVKNMITALKDYNDVLNEIIGELRGETLVSNEIKAKIDKNVLAVFTELNLHIGQTVTFKNISTKKEKLFDRLKKGFSYKYKLNDGSLIENPQIIKFEGITIDPIHRKIQIEDITFQLSNSFDYSSCASLNLSQCESSEEDTDDINVVDSFIDKMHTEINKTLTLQAYLDILYSCLNYVLKSIISDVKHYNLFDETCLDDM